MQIPSIRRFTPLLLLALISAIATVVYWSGLSGPFLLDDWVALQPVASWMSGEQPLMHTLFSNESLLMHRTLSMASFALNVAMGGDSGFSLKLGNLLHHIAAAFIAFALLGKMLSRDPRLSRHARWLALAIVALWVMHPLYVSTVLYITQRMAQVAALFSLLGMWFYMFVRGRMQSGRLSPKHGVAIIWLGIPLLTFLGIQGKQNAATLPVMCLVLELAYFTGPRNWPTSMRVFFGLFAALPIVAVPIALLIQPDSLLLGYWNYDFGPYERVLTQARALWKYAFEMLAPYSPAMGVYGDDFVVSRGLLTPPTTLLSIMALIGASAAAISLRKTMPSLFAGWFLFLSGHLVESSILPLEMYYEHRNYLPGLGILLCAISIADMALEALARHGLRAFRISIVAYAGALLVLVIQLGGRVHVWSSPDTLLASSVATHPGSKHANFGYMNLLLKEGRVEDTYRHLSMLSHSSNPSLRAVSVLYKINADCVLRMDASPEDFRAAIGLLSDGRIDLNTMQTLDSTVTKSEARECGRLTRKIIADEIRALADHASEQPDNTFTKFTVRHLAARMYAADQDWENAAVQARLSWQSAAPAVYSAVLMNSLVALGRLDEADAVLAEATLRVRPYDLKDREGLRNMREYIERARAEAGKARTGTGHSPP